MKRILLILAFVLPGIGLLAQSDKYNTAMTQQIAKMDAAMQNGSFGELANSFERIGEAEKTQWLPYYYAAYCQVMLAITEKDKSKVDVLADRAEALITKSETIAGAENSEISVVKSMVASARMMVDPQSRWMQYGQVSASHLEKAKQLDPSNPRPVYLEGQSKFYTPQEFGGGKAVAAPIFEKALTLFDSFKPASGIHPAWGKEATRYFLAQCK